MQKDPAPFLSIAMTTYNGEAFVIQQLQSIYEQTQQVDEVVICDDRSTDDTVELVEKFIASNKLSTWRLIRNDVQLGFSDNFWKAVDACKGELIFLSDQDDVWHRQKVEEMVLAMQSKKGVVLVSSSFEICDSSGLFRTDVNVPYMRRGNDGSTELIATKDMIGRSPIRGCSLLFRKAILSGEDRPSLSAGLGHDWYIAVMATLKGKAIYLNKRLFNYRVHAHNTSGQRVKRTHNMKKIINKRIRYLNEEVTALETLSGREDVVGGDQILMMKQIAFANRRLRLVRNSNIFQVPLLVGHVKKYARIYDMSVLGGARLLFGDVTYGLVNLLYREGL